VVTLVTAVKGEDIDAVLQGLSHKCAAVTVRPIKRAPHDDPNWTVDAAFVVDVNFPGNTRLSTGADFSKVQHFVSTGIRS